MTLVYRFPWGAIAPLHPKSGRISTLQSKKAQEPQPFAGHIKTL